MKQTMRGGKRMFGAGVLAGGLSLLLMTTVPAMAACTLNIGELFALSGSMGDQGQGTARAARMGADMVNAAGGVRGCHVHVVTADSETNPAVAVDAAKRMIDIEHVRAIVGSNSSGTTIAVLRSVSEPAGVMLVSPTAASSSFTVLARKGLTGGAFMRTVMSVGDEGPVTAYVAHDLAHWRRVSVIYVNNAFGTTYAQIVADSLRRLGIDVLHVVPYNTNQPSYDAVVDKALTGGPQALVLLGHPEGSQVVLREWLQKGGPHQAMLADSIATQAFVDKSGGRLLNGWAIDEQANRHTSSYRDFLAAYQRRYERAPRVSYDNNAFDAMVITLLSLAKVGEHAKPAQLFAAARSITRPGGVAVYPTRASLAHGFEVLAAGGKIHYLGATGNLELNRDGDVTTPMVVSRISDGRLVPTDQLNAAQVLGVVKRVEAHGAGA